jgi:CRISPR-associated protein Cst2
MATHYLYGTILTHEAVAANNRGETVGNTTTLHKIFHQDDLHTSVSAESIRFAIRYRFQLEGMNDRLNRTYELIAQEGVSNYKLKYKDEKRLYWDVRWDKDKQMYKSVSDRPVFVDDDLLGFMNAEKGRVEKEEDAESQTTDQESPKKKKKAPKGKADIWASPLAVGRAVSLRPYRGELSFNCVSGQKDEDDLSLYNAEMHCTEYQYSFGLNLSNVIEKANIKHLIDAIIDLPPVAGNHARFAYDFSPASIILRVSTTHSSKIQNCFEHEEETRSYTIKRLVDRVESGDVMADGLFVGGELSRTHEGARLRELGAQVFLGIRATADAARERIGELQPSFRVVAEQNKNKNGG